MLIDTHTHLYYDKFEADLDDVIARAVSAGVTQVINIGADLESSRKALRQAQGKLAEVSGFSAYCTIGIHPHETINMSSDESIHENIERLEQLYHTQPDQIVAIGECGLDYSPVDSPAVILACPESDSGIAPLSRMTMKELQKKLFLAQIKLAKKLNLPLMIHCRDSWSDIFVPQLKGTRGTFHHFTSTLEDAQKALDLGYYLSFSCVVTYPKNEHLRQIIKTIPMDRILTETDSPYLPPQTKRGQRNEPVNVTEVVKMIAEVKNLSFDDVAQQTFINAQRLFQLN